MKKILLIAAAVLGVALFSGCNNVEYEPFMQSVDVLIKNNDWREAKDEHGNIRGLFVDVDFPEITRRVINNGAVLAYVFNADGMQEPLSQSLWGDYVYQNKYYTYEEVITFAYTVNKVRFYYNTSDFNYPSDQPGDRSFRVVIIQ